MPNFYQIYRNSYSDFGVFNDSVPYFSMLSEKFINLNEVDERDLIRRMDSINISLTTFYSYLYNPNRMLLYKDDDIKTFYDQFPNWNDLMSAMFSVPVSKSTISVKIEKPEVIRSEVPTDIDKKIVINCNNIIKTIQKMCGPDTIIGPNSISDFFDKTKDDELMLYRKELATKALEEYFVRFFLLFGYVVNQIPDEEHPIDISMKYTYDIFKKYYTDVLASAIISPQKGYYNFYRRLYDTHETISRETELILGKGNDDRLTANLKDRSVVYEPYYINSVINSLAVRDVHFFNISVMLSFLDQDLIDLMQITPMTQLNLTPEDLNPVRELYESVDVNVETDADDFSVDTEDYLIVGISKEQNKFKLLCRNPGTALVTVRAQKEGYLEHVKTMNVTVLKPESTILRADPASLTLKVGEKKTVNVYTNANDFAHGIVGDNADSIATRDEPEQGVIEVTGVGVGHVMLRLIAKTLDLPATTIYVPITVIDGDAKPPIEVKELPPFLKSLLPTDGKGWDEGSTLVSEEQVRNAFYFTKRMFEAYVITNVKAKRQVTRVATHETYHVLENQKSSIFEPFYLNDSETLLRASDESELF